MLVTVALTKLGRACMQAVALVLVWKNFCSHFGSSSGSGVAHAQTADQADVLQDLARAVASLRTVLAQPLLELD